MFEIVTSWWDILSSSSMATPLLAWPFYDKSLHTLLHKVASEEKKKKKKKKKKTLQVRK
jgi:hypothetical protein